MEWHHLQISPLMRSRCVSKRRVARECGWGGGIPTHPLPHTPFPTSFLTHPSHAPPQGKAVHVMDVPLPSGCAVEATIPGTSDAFGILYREPEQHQLGALIWDGFASQVRRGRAGGGEGKEERGG